MTLKLENVKSANYKEYNGGNDSCLLCGAELKKPTHYVHLNLAGDLVDARIVDEFESLGFFPVGRECRTNLPSDFVWKDTVNGFAQR